MARKVPATRYFRSRKPGTRYRLSFTTADEYFADAFDEQGLPIEPGPEKWAYYLEIETYDPEDRRWWAEGPFDYGVVRTVREAEELAGERVMKEESK